MKKLILFFYCCFCIATKINAQVPFFNDENKVFNGGIIVGANICKLDDVDDFTSYHKVGLNAGGIVYTRFSETFGVSMEILFSQKGDKEVSQANSYSVGSYFSQYLLKLNYIEVPITIHYLQKRMDYEMGFSYSRLISSNESIYSDPPVIINPLINYFNKDDYELIFGGTYHLFKHYYFNLRWQFSLLQIRPIERTPGGFYFDGQQNNVLNFRIIYYL